MSGIMQHLGYILHCHRMKKLGVIPVSYKTWLVMTE
jgi:hypothetical protein